MIQGTYESSKQFGKMFNIRVDGSNYGFGSKDPADLGLEVGDTVKFDTSQNGKYTNADVSTVEIVSKASSGGTTNNTGTRTSSNMNKNDYWEQKAEADAARQTIIEFQSSRNAAVSTVDMMIKNGLVKLPAQAKQYDYALGLIEEVTNVYNTQLENVRQFGLPVSDETVSAEQSADELE